MIIDVQTTRNLQSPMSEADGLCLTTRVQIIKTVQLGCEGLRRMNPEQEAGAIPRFSELAALGRDTHLATAMLKIR